MKTYVIESKGFNKSVTDKYRVELEKMAQKYGVSVDELKQILKDNKNE